MRMSYRMFKGVFKSWDGLCEEAAAFASTLGPDRVCSISHSADRSDGVVIVWYWE
jgi:hypothetical protein